MRIPFSLPLSLSSLSLVTIRQQPLTEPDESVVRSATIERNMQAARQIVVGFKPGFWTNGSTQTKQACFHGPGTTITRQGPVTLLSLVGPCFCTLNSPLSECVTPP